MAKPKKKRAKKYDDKLAIKSNYEDVIKVSVVGNPAPKPKKTKKNLPQVNTIEVGDTVKHKKWPRLNGGLAFNVIGINSGMAECEFFDLNGEVKKEWFDMKDLEITHKVSGNPTPKPKLHKGDKKKDKKKAAPGDFYNYQEDERELGGEG
jgi:uncharacterized protein YodC (DUF2158 family)